MRCIRIIVFVTWNMSNIIYHPCFKKLVCSYTLKLLVHWKPYGIYVIYVYIANIYCRMVKVSFAWLSTLFQTRLGVKYNIKKRLSTGQVMSVFLSEYSLHKWAVTWYTSNKKLILYIRCTHRSSMWLSYLDCCWCWQPLMGKLFVYFAWYRHLVALTAQGQVIKDFHQVRRHAVRRGVPRLSW